MKKYFKAFGCILVIVILFSVNTFPQAMRIMTFNIRLDLAADSANAWNNRKANLVSMITFHKADIIGLQEAQKHQIDYIQQLLPDYSWFGVGRDDGKTEGEFTAIFYRKDRFDTLETSTFWCSETPEHFGLGWDAAYERITTFGKIRDKQTEKIFYVFNTHLDNEGATARLESVKLIKKKMRAICDGYPIILTGDFNSTPDSDPYKSIVSNSDSNTTLELFDSRTLSKTKPHGPSGSFTGFDLNAIPKEPIDFVFVRKGISVLYHGILSDSFDGFLPSDHYPVLAEIIL